MTCEFDRCIYNREWKCLLDEVNINNLGMCDDCILISLDWDFLEAEKERQLQALEERWDNWGK